MIEAHSSSDTSAVGARAVRPAALTRMSTAPKRSSTASRRASTDARTPTSAVCAKALPPPFSISSQTSRTSPPRRPAGTVLAPARASPTAIARPRPEVPPTTTATRPVKSVMFSAMLFCTPRRAAAVGTRAGARRSKTFCGRDLDGRLFPSPGARAPAHPRAEVAGEHALDVALDLRPGHGAAALEQPLVRFGECFRDDAARVAPLVDQLLEYARVRVLREEARPEQLQRLGRHLRDDRRVVEEPPAPERQQVPELPRRHAQLVLVLPREERRQEFYVRVLGTQALDG